MKININKTVTLDAIYLQVDCEVRHLEDSSVNGEFGDSSNIPFLKDSRWKPLLNLDKGIVENWVKGTTMEVYINACDDGIYTLLDHYGNVVAKHEGYVPKMLDTSSEWHGDYIDMRINGDGVIENFKASFEGFDGVKA